MAIAYGSFGKYEYHLMREGSRTGRPFFEIKRDKDDLWVWAFGLELIVSRRR